MLDQNQISLFFSFLEQSLASNTFVKLSFGNYKGTEDGLKNLYIKKVLIKEEEKLSFTYRYKTRDIVKNYSENLGIGMIKSQLGDSFLVANLFTTEEDLQLEIVADHKIVLRKTQANHKALPDLGHDRNKKRHIVSGGQSYLHDLQITNAEGQVMKHAQDKYKQINHYIELLRVMLNELPKHERVEVVDMGSGKGYLTFALYDYLTNTLQLNASVTGVEYRTDLVTLCNEIAVKNNFSNLRFVEGSIEQYDCKDANILIALHACDTATDDAIYKGITANADLIVVAPCCHKQIRNEIEKNKKSNAVDFITQHGIYLERQAEMVTDSIRALILEYYGYKTKVFEFISEAHTPKNVMITGERGRTDSMRKDKILQELKEAKEFFGIKKHYLEVLLGM